MRALIAIGCLAALFVSYGSAHGSPQPSVQYGPPSVASTVDALYPPLSVAWGTVTLEVNVDSNGNVAGVRVVHGIASLTESAETSVRQWKFQPATVNGKPVSSKVTTAFTFVQPGVGPMFQQH